MAIISKEDLRKMSPKQMDEKLKELKLELMKEKGVSEVGAGVKNPGHINEMRKTIARIKFMKNKKEVDS